jgi:DNA modification methylase
MENYDLDDMVDNLHSREDFVDFLKYLLYDLENNRGEWENFSLENYLDAIARWTDSIDSVYKNNGWDLPQNINWKVFGQILLAAKIYE